MNCMENKGVTDKCPHCGYTESMYRQNANHLPFRTVLNNRYVTGKALGQGGFGITYIAWDDKLDIPVAIKEYLPLSLAGRSDGSNRVSAHSVQKEDTFRHHLDKFLQEARILAKFNNEKGIVSVQDIFEENATAYIVMFYINGETLEKNMQILHRTYTFKEAIQIMDPVMKALAKIHGAGLVHRDISPDNIFITFDNQVKLLDFGAAKFMIMEEGKSVSVVLKRGYAPFEQYSVKRPQGPWTDVYSVAATLYRMMTGETPPEASDRIVKDDILFLSAYGVELPEQAEAALMKALSVNAENRFQNMSEFISALEEDDEVKTEILESVSDDSKREPEVCTASENGAVRNTKRIYKIIAACAVIIVILLAGENNLYDLPAANMAASAEKLSLMTFISKAEAKVLADCTMEDTGIELSIQNYDKDSYNPIEYSNYIKTRLASEDVPDLIELPVGSYRNGIIDAPAALMDLSGEDFISDISKVYRDFASFEGRIYSVPYGPAYLNTWLYNRKVYDELGLYPPETWDELLSNCETIKKSGRVPVMAPFKEAWTSYMYYVNAFYYMEADDPQFVNGFIDGKINLQTNPGFIKALRDLKLLLDKGYLNADSNETDYTKAIDDFANGRAVHFPIGAWALGSFNSYYNGMANDIGMFTMPWNNSGQNGTSAVMPSGLCISKSTGHRENALKFLKYYISKDTVEKLRTKTLSAVEDKYVFGGIPLIKGYEFPEGTIQAIRDEVSIFNSGNVKAQLSDEVLFFDQAGDIAQEFIDAANGKTTPEAAADRIGRELKKAADTESVRVK